MAHVIPMAGVGSRFSENGYLLPKPLIPVAGVPMILRVIDALPPSDTWVFIVRQEHIDTYGIDAVITKRIPNAIIIPVSETTAGQASTCALALPHIDPEEPMLIAACDNSFVYDAERHQRIVDDPTIDASVWTFTRHPVLAEKPESWGWVRRADDGVTITDISVKKPVSADPFNDHAVVATFYFRRAADFARAYERMVAEDHRINGEFYVDAMPIHMHALGKRSVVFPVDLYVGWGKPSDLHLFEYWEYMIKAGRVVEDAQYPLWKRYIETL